MLAGYMQGYFNAAQYNFFAPHNAKLEINFYWLQLKAQMEIYAGQTIPTEGHQ